MGHKTTAKFIERSIKNAVDFFNDAVFSESIARSRGLLQSVGPKMKIAILVVLLGMTIFAQGLLPLTLLYALSLILAGASGIDILYFVKRVWLFIPIFTLVIAIPAVFTHGLSTAALFVLRVADCVSFVVLVTITTRHNRLLRSLRSLGIPLIFVKVLDMMYRYIFFFIRIFEDMHLSLKSRLLKNFDSRSARRWISSRAAFLFKKSIRMSEDVYMAMVARGYGIEVKDNGG